MAFTSLYSPVSAPRGMLRAVPRARTVFVLLTLGLAAAVVAAFALSVAAWTPAAAVATVLVAASALWIAGGAATAVIGYGLGQPAPGPSAAPRLPSGRTAVLVMICGEAPAPVAARVAALRAGLDRTGLGEKATVFVLSDTRGGDRAAAEDAAFAPLVAAGAVVLRRRAVNAGLKPGNIADWLSRWGDGFDYMLVLDADSRMSADRIVRMVARMEAQPRLGLLQAAIGLVPGRTVFGRHQRTAARLAGPVFARGFAAWSGRTANYWGHNALIRVAAFRAASGLPRLPGPPPFGGPILSHDFVEAAWIRRDGWHVELDPAVAGSAEEAPQTLEEFHRRDRRWCQGNLQHLRLVAGPGLHPLSRFHMISGVFSYLAAPVWLALLALSASGAVRVESALPLVLVGLLLLLPKLCGLLAWFDRRMTRRRLAVLLRAWSGELVLSALLAPVMMVRQSLSVLSILAGRDCGWKAGRGARALPPGAVEAVAGCAFVAAALAAGPAGLWLAPVALSLLLAPLALRRLEA